MNDFVTLYMHGYAFKMAAGRREATVLGNQINALFVSYFRPKPGMQYRAVCVTISTRQSLADVEVEAAGLEPTGAKQVFQIGREKGFGEYYQSQTRSMLLLRQHFAISMDLLRGTIDVHLARGSDHESGRANIPSARSYFYWMIREWLALNGCFCIHAAGVANERGGIIIVGDSGAGKSTLSLSLAKRAYGFLGDDAVIVDSRTDPPQMMSFAMPAKVDEQTIGFHPELALLLDESTSKCFDEVGGMHEYRFAPQRFGLRLVDIAPVNALICLEPRRDAEQPAIEELPLAVALARLLRSSEHEPATQREKARFDTLTRLVDGARTLVCRTEQRQLFDVGLIERALDTEAWC